MRKIIAWELVSVDGVMESPEEWAFSYADDEIVEANASGMTASDALLMGQVTYEELAAYWPNQPGDAPMVDYLNSVPKAGMPRSSSFQPLRPCATTSSASRSPPTGRKPSRPRRSYHSRSRSEAPCCSPARGVDRYQPADVFR